MKERCILCKYSKLYAWLHFIIILEAPYNGVSEALDYQKTKQNLLDWEVHNRWILLHKESVFCESLEQTKYVQRKVSLFKSYYAGASNLQNNCSQEW